MCVSFCPRRWALFWNHEDCEPRDCDFATGPHGRCETCQNRQNENCGLTNAPQPAAGCCQHNVAPVSGLLEISWDMLAPLRIGPDEMVEQFLQDYDVPYHHGPQAEVMVDPDDLGLPQTFGIGTEHVTDEKLDWSEWAEQWCLDDAACRG